MKKVFLFFAAIMLSAMSIQTAWAAKITSVADLVSGTTYYIGATTSKTDYYLQLASTDVKTGIKGTAVTSKATATTFVLAGSAESWTIKVGENYLTLANAKANGQVNIQAEEAVWTLTDTTDLINAAINGYALQKNNSGTQFGSYGGTQTNIWFEAVVTKSIDSIVVSGTPNKMTYRVGDSFKPEGLVATAYYSDKSTEDVTNDATWTATPESFTEVSTSASVSVVATLNKLESKAFVVNGIVVNEYIQTYANTYTSNISNEMKDSVNIEGKKFGAIKAGTSKVAGSTTITVPADTKTLHFHAAGWKDETVVISVTDGDEISESYDLVADNGITGNSPYSLQNDPETNDYFTLAIGNKEEITLTITATSGKRFVLFGINAEKGITTSVETVSEKADFIKTIENGQVVIIRNGVRHNVAGQIIK